MSRAASSPLWSTPRRRTTTSTSPPENRRPCSSWPSASGERSVATGCHSAGSPTNPSSTTCNAASPRSTRRAASSASRPPRPSTRCSPRSFRGSVTPWSKDGSDAEPPVRSALSSKRGAVAALVLVAVLLAPVATGARRAPVWPMDEGSLLVYPQLLRHGDQPHRDFETLYGPGNIWVLGAAYSATKPTIGVERAVGLAYRLTIIAAIAVLAWPAGVLVAASSALVAGIIAFALGLPAFAWLGALALALAGLAAIATARRSGGHPSRWLAGGALLGAAVVFRL